MPSVLIVDDDVDLLEMVSLVLTTYDLEVHCITKGLLVFESVASLTPDLILMDIYLGDSDGRSLCYSLKTSEKFQHIPVILYSAGVITSSSVQRALADKFIVKPFAIDELLNDITALL